MRLRQAVQASIAGVLLIMASPVLILCAFAIVAADGRPILFRQVRVGRYGRPFSLVKLRTMSTTSAGAAITTMNDPRVTRTGVIIRRYKIDEIPQLWNIICGDMSFIGPRPEVPRYVDMSNPSWREVLRVAPGLVDLASLMFRNEESFLGQQQDIDGYYREHLLPQKLLLSAYYQRHRTLIWDIRLMLLTILLVLAPYQVDAGRIANMFGYEEL